MRTEIITLSISRELREKVDRLRGDIARSKFISRLIENAIGKHTKQNQVPTTTETMPVVGVVEPTKGGSLDG